MDASSPELTCCAILFDLDGVLVDSTECIAGVWGKWATRHDLDPAMVRTAAHGRRAGEVVRLIAPGLDAAVEDAALEWAEAHATEGLCVVPGAGALLASLPPGAWAVVTSALGSVATHRLRQTGLRVPPVFVVAEDVAHGKPDPEGYTHGGRTSWSRSCRLPRHRGCVGRHRSRARSRDARDRDPRRRRRRPSWRSGRRRRGPRGHPR